MDAKQKKDACLHILKEKYQQLQEKGEERYPCRSDFSREQVIAIKAYLGPWPRALEMAGIKPSVSPAPKENR